MPFEAFEMGEQCHPRQSQGWHCSPIWKASNGIARCVLGRLTAFYQCTMFLVSEGWTRVGWIKWHHNFQIPMSLIDTKSDYSCVVSTRPNLCSKRPTFDLVWYKRKMPPHSRFLSSTLPLIGAFK